MIGFVRSLKQHSDFLFYAILILIIIGVYWSMLDNFFYSDDFEHLGLIISSFPNILDVFSSFFKISTALLHIVDYLTIALFGINPLAFQIIDLMIHIINVVLVGVFVAILTKNRIAGFFSSFFWGLNDKYTEVVLESFQKGRSILFLLLFLSLIFITKYLQERKNKYYVLSLITCILAFFTYWDFVVVCPIIVSYVFLFYGVKKGLRRTLPFIFIFIIYTLLQMIFQNTVLAYERYSFDWNCLSRFSVNILDFLGLYGFGCGSNILGFIFILLVIIVFVTSKDKIIKFGFLFFIVSSIPSFMVKFQAPRYMYVPLFGITLIFIRLFIYFLDYCQKRKWLLLKYSIPTIFFIIIGVSHSYGIIIDEDYRDYRGRISKDLYFKFENIFSQIPKNSAVALVDLDSKNFRGIGYTYYSMYPERFYFKRLVYIYKRDKGVMGLIYLNDLVAFVSFKQGNIYNWQGIQSDKVKEYKTTTTLVYSNGQFTLVPFIDRNMPIKDIGAIEERL